MMTARLLATALALLTLGLPTAVPATAEVHVKVETSAGDFVIRLDEARAPLTVANFLEYVKSGFYAGTIFHRVVSGFVIQGGGYSADMALKPPRPTVVNESGNGLSNRRGTVAMARTAEPHSGDAQFYVNLADNLALDPKPTRWGYAVFGEVVQGLEVVDEIGHRPTGTKAGMQDVPVEPVLIRRIALVPAPAAQ